MVSITIYSRLSKTASDVIGFELVFYTHARLSVNGTPVEWNTFFWSLHVSFNESLLYSHGQSVEPKIQKFSIFLKVAKNERALGKKFKK